MNQEKKIEITFFHLNRSRNCLVQKSCLNLKFETPMGTTNDATLPAPQPQPQ